MPTDGDLGGFAHAAWYLVPLRVTDDVGWHFIGAPSVGRLSPNQFQVHHLDEVEVAAVRGAMDNLRCPVVVVPEIEVDPSTKTVEWSIPVQRSATRVCLERTALSDRLYYDVYLVCDDMPMNLKVPASGYLLVYGFPSNASLIALIAFQ
jgi:hypothetical protein